MNVHRCCCTAEQCTTTSESAKSGMWSLGSIYGYEPILKALCVCLKVLLRTLGTGLPTVSLIDIVLL